jgi:hypothetical protein
MRAFWPAFACSIILAPATIGLGATFPYEAIVDDQEAYVRSGPGSKYYPTGKVTAGQRVMVHRHDPGGWFMIAPPPGSFSWIKGEHVDRAEGDRGIVKSNNVVVRVGSFESDIRDLFQRRLSTGDEVRILGEKMLAPDGDGSPAELWYRIVPPRGEWRWIAGQSVTAASAATVPPSGSGTKRNGATDPFESPESIGGAGAAPDAPSFEPPEDVATARSHQYNDDSRRGRAPGDSGGLRERPLRRNANDSQRSASAGGSKRQEDADWEELDRLDARLRAILNKETLQWDFNELEPDYRRLGESTASAALQRTVDGRLTSIDRFRSERATAEDQQRFLQETLRRDAELQELQRRHEMQLTRLSNPRFDGAGIVDRVAGKSGPGPRYVLMASDGRVLAFLEPAPGVNLEPWIRRPAGVVGARSFRPELKADLIVVTGLSPVRLTPVP